MVYRTLELHRTDELAFCCQILMTDLGLILKKTKNREDSRPHGFSLIAT
jgi:hypothetical protein